MRGKLIVVGAGPAGPEHATLKGLAAISKADYVICWSDLQTLFTDYIKGKPVLDPFKEISTFKGKKIRELTESEMVEYHEYYLEKTNEVAAIIQEQIRLGKKVVFIETGDPCLFSVAAWHAEKLAPEDVEMIPGMSSFSAANATLGKSLIHAYDTRFVLITTPNLLSEDMVKDVAKYESTIVMFMAIDSLDRWIPLFQKYFPLETPVGVVFSAGHSDKEEVIEGTLGDIVNQLQEKIGERQRGALVYIGKFLKGKASRFALEDTKYFLRMYGFGWDY